MYLPQDQIQCTFLEKLFVLKPAVKVINGTRNFDGLSPSLVAFGMLPRFPPANSDLPKQEEKMRALQVARLKMETITAKLRI